MMFRIYCSFRPEFKRANGSRYGQKFKQGRGAWVVSCCITSGQPEVVIKRESLAGGEYIGVLCPTSRRTGTRCSPRKLLAEYQKALHITRALNRLGNSGWPRRG